jgi:hypothetical protein
MIGPGGSFSTPKYKQSVKNAFIKSGLIKNPETNAYNPFVSSGKRGTTNFETTVFRDVVIEVAAEAGN